MWSQCGWQSCFYSKIFYKLFSNSTAVYIHYLEIQCPNPILVHLVHPSSLWRSVRERWPQHSSFWGDATERCGPVLSSEPGCVSVCLCFDAAGLLPLRPPSHSHSSPLGPSWSCNLYGYPVWVQVIQNKDFGRLCWSQLGWGCSSRERLESSWLRSASASPQAHGLNSEGWLGSFQFRFLFFWFQITLTWLDSTWYGHHSGIIIVTYIYAQQLDALCDTHLWV